MRELLLILKDEKNESLRTKCNIKKSELVDMGFAFIKFARTRARTAIPEGTAIHEYRIPRWWQIREPYQQEKKYIYDKKGRVRGEFEIGGGKIPYCKALTMYRRYQVKTEAENVFIYDNQNNEVIQQWSSKDITVEAAKEILKQKFPDRAMKAYWED